MIPIDDVHDSIQFALVGKMFRPPFSGLNECVYIFILCLNAFSLFINNNYYIIIIINCCPAVGRRK